MNETLPYAVQQTTPLWQYLFDWMPLLIFIGLLLFFMRRLKPQQSEAKQYRVEHMTELRRQNELLDRIARALEQRPPA